MFTLTLDTDNAAFTDDPAREVRRILRKICVEGIDAGSHPLLDINGNTVGTYVLDEVSQ